MGLVVVGVAVLLVADWLDRRGAMPGFRRCPSCGIPVPAGRRVCPHCSCALGQQQIAKEVSSRLAGLQIVNRYWKVNPWAGQRKLKSAPAALGQMRSEFLKKLTCYSVVVSPFVPSSSSLLLLLLLLLLCSMSR